jgi:hypothetical protein
MYTEQPAPSDRIHLPRSKRLHYLTGSHGSRSMFCRADYLAHVVAVRLDHAPGHDFRSWIGGVNFALVSCFLLSRGLELIHVETTAITPYTARRAALRQKLRRLIAHLT